jgi:Zn finger protein HypA/HybF involved in hydrogenase expression
MGRKRGVFMVRKCEKCGYEGEDVQHHHSGLLLCPDCEVKVNDLMYGE